MVVRVNGALGYMYVLVYDVCSYYIPWYVICLIVLYWVAVNREFCLFLYYAFLDGSKQPFPVFGVLVM